MAGTETPARKRLRDRNWDVSYSHEDGDLVELFFLPALERATLYQRATGYFSGSALVMAARGMDALIEAGGRMELLVGCTLNQDDVEKIQQGYHIRELAESEWGRRISYPDDNPWARRQLGYLAWMIARGYLDVKLAIPLDERGEMRAGLSLYHAKMGIVTDEHRDQLVFRGSINETAQGWLSNCESFDVNRSWVDGFDPKRVEKAGVEFAKLWTGNARSARVLDFPQAMKERLLEFLPEKDDFVRPRADARELEEETLGEAPPFDAPISPPPPLANDERRRLVWSFIKNAPKREDGALVAVKTSAVTPWPHQLRAYKRMLDSWPFRLLLADEVGLGKTIEAGLIIRHVWISELAKRILIMTPKGVLSQWQSELYEKFNLLVPIYTGHSLVWPAYHGRAIPLEQKVGRTEWAKQPLVLVSSHLMRRKDRQHELIEADGWDLLVLDEAHHARRKGPGTAQEGGPNRLLRLMYEIKGKAKSLLLMTATPMQVHPIELWDLLNLLGLPAAWNETAFLRYFETLHENPTTDELYDTAKLFQATEVEFGETPAYDIERIGTAVGLNGVQRAAVLQALRERKSKIPIKKLETNQRNMALALLKAGNPVSRRMSRHTRSLLREYFKRGMIDAPVPDRDVRDIAVELSSAERSLYEAVEDYISDTYEKASREKKTAVGFVMTVYRRRLASSFYALRQTLNDRFAKLSNQSSSCDPDRAEEDVSLDETAEESMSPDEAADLERDALTVEEQSEIQRLLRDLARLGTDTKALTLLSEIKAALADGFDSALVFTQYTDTIDFLRDFLADRLELRIGCFSSRGGETRDASGAWVRCSKERIKRSLREGTIQVLVCSDAAGEGLNLQTCGVLINYDLPWNPMKVEQRIGRIDRIGQKFPKIRIINLAYADTVEADVYFALSKRINLFQGVVGKLQPILSQLAKEFAASILRRKADRDRGRQDAVHHVQTLVQEAENAAFDIDEVSDADLASPVFQPCPLTPEDVERVLRRPDLLPAGVTANELDPGTFSLVVPGRSEPLRVTAAPSIFEDHFENHQLVLYDSPVFGSLVELSGCEVVGEAWRDPLSLDAIL